MPDANAAHWGVLKIALRRWRWLVVGLVLWLSFAGTAKGCFNGNCPTPFPVETRFYVPSHRTHPLWIAVGIAALAVLGRRSGARSGPLRARPSSASSGRAVVASPPTVAFLRLGEASPVTKSPAMARDRERHHRVLAWRRSLSHTDHTVRAQDYLHQHNINSSRGARKSGG